MHPIKRHILYHLILNPYLNFARLKPKDIEGNIFTYHLKQLITEGLVRKSSYGYELTDEGKIYADKLSLKNLNPRIQPKIVTLLICQNQKKEYLLYQRKRQPFLNLVGFPYGKIHLGETVLQSAKRELLEKTGLNGILTHQGDVYLTIFEKNNLLTQMLCHIILVKNPQGELKSSSDIGECFWINIKKVSQNKLMPGAKDIYHLAIKKKSFFFAEFTFNT